VIQVPDMHHVGPHPAEHLLEHRVEAYVPVPVLEVGHVDHVESDPRIVGVDVLRERVGGRERVLLAGEHVHLVPGCEGLAERLAVDLGPCVVAARVTVDDLQDAHHATACGPRPRRKSAISRASPSRSATCGRQPRTARAREGSP
jgi:hypothetical protein